MTKTILTAAALLGLAFGPAFAAEGNGEPFRNNTRVGSVPHYVLGQQVADTGSERQPDLAGRPGSDLPALAGDVLPTNGSQAAVQTANSLPSGFEEGTVTFAQAQSVNGWMLAHQGRNTTGRYATR